MKKTKRDHWKEAYMNVLHYYMREESGGDRNAVLPIYSIVDVIEYYMPKKKKK